MSADLAEVGDIADVIPEPVGGPVTVFQLESHVIQQIDGFQNRGAVSAASAKIVYFAGTWTPIEVQKEAGYVVGMDLIADLLALMTIDDVFAPGLWRSLLCRPDTDPALAPSRDIL